jgi:hypothetical protein
LFILGL